MSVAYLREYEGRSCCLAIIDGKEIRPETFGSDPTDFRNSFQMFLGNATPLRDSRSADLAALSNARVHAASFHQFFQNSISHRVWLTMLTKLSKQIKHAMLSGIATTGAMSSSAPNPKRHVDPRAIVIGQRIRTKRELLGFTTEELGSMIGVTRNAVTQYETGRATPKPKRFEALAVALGTTTTWLLTGNEPDELARAQTKAELEALQMLRSLPLDRQEIFLDMLRGLSDVKSKK